MVTTYVYCCLNIASNIPIPELPGSGNDNAGLSFYLAPPREQSAKHLWLHHWLSAEGAILLSYRQQGSHHWLRFPGLADFLISANAKKISCYPVPEVPEETIGHLLLDQVLPRCLAHQGKIMLHASAVQLEQGLILFLGDSGTGKSTLAGNFHQAGHPAVSDDCVWIHESQDQIRAVPSYGGLRLWEDSLEVLFAAEQDTYGMAHYSTKRRVPLHGNDVSGNGIPVLAVIMISPPDQSSASEIIVERLSHREAFIAMLKQTFQLNLMDRERMTRHIQALGSSVPRLPSFRLSMRREYDLLPRVRQKILKIVL